MWWIETHKICKAHEFIITLKKYWSPLESMRVPFTLSFWCKLYAGQPRVPEGKCCYHFGRKGRTRKSPLIDGPGAASADAQAMWWQAGRELVTEYLEGRALKPLVRTSNALYLYRWLCLYGHTRLWSLDPKTSGRRRALSWQVTG